MAYKVYCGLSSRRFSTDLLEAHERGFITKPVPGAKVTAFFEDPYFTPILKEGCSSYSTPAPRGSVESDFAIDSSGFGSSRYESYYDHKYGVTRKKCIWVKTHIACGVKTNVVTAVRILDKDAADCPQFVPLLKETRRHFEIGEVSAQQGVLDARELRGWYRVRWANSTSPSRKTRPRSAVFSRRRSTCSSSTRTPTRN